MPRTSLHMSVPAHLTVKENPNDYTKNANKQSRPELLKRIQLDKLMDLKVDYAFKQLHCGGYWSLQGESGSD